MKRAIDVLIAGTGLVVCAPLLGVVAVLVKIDVGSPVLFRQRRPGYKGKPFELLKFRTMREERTVSGESRPDAKRLTRLGTLLRATSLDELPELWNVLRGDMSLVGPRPLLLEYLPRYTAAQMRRHDALPGITGWAQVNGRNGISWEEKFALDLWYVEHRTTRLDLEILAKTLWKVLKREGISASGEATMPAFLGTREVPATAGDAHHVRSSSDA